MAKITVHYFPQNYSGYYISINACIYHICMYIDAEQIASYLLINQIAFMKLSSFLCSYYLKDMTWSLQLQKY